MSCFCDIKAREKCCHWCIHLFCPFVHTFFGWFGLAI
jgi:hypothetical protein